MTAVLPDFLAAAPPAAEPLPPPRATANAWTALLQQIAEEVRLDDDHVRMGNSRLAVPPRRGHGRRETLTAALAAALYHRYYHHHATPGRYRPADDGADRRPAAAREDPAFCGTLRERLGTRFFWDDGWHSVGRAASGSLLVERDDLVLHVEPAEVRPGAHGLQVRFPADRPWASTGFFSVTGVAGAARRTSGPARCYLHLLPGTAAEVFAGLVGDLDRRALPFTAKVLNDPAAFGRPDSAVVYAARDDLPAVVEAALARYSPDGFGQPVPAFTRAVVPGVAVADDPGAGASFGQHRCCAIASGLLAAGPHADRTERLAGMYRALADEGLDVDALHLNPGNADFVLPEP